MLHQFQGQKQTVKILPHQIKLLSIFHLTALQLEQRIQDELMDNPLLEENNDENEAELKASDKTDDFRDWEEYGYDDIPDYKTEYQNYFHDEQVPGIPVSEVADFREELKVQTAFRLATDEEKKMMNFLIDSLTGSGMLEEDLETVAEDYSFRFQQLATPEVFEKLLLIIQETGSPGVGARTIQECLLLQLKRKNQGNPLVKKSTQLIRDHYADLAARRMEKIMESLQVDEEELNLVIRFMGSLQLKPVEDAGGYVQKNNNICPDFVVVKEEEKIKVSLYRQRSSTLFISNTWADMVREKAAANESGKQAIQYLKSKLNSANWFISAIKEREKNMLNIMNAIVHLQYDFFKTGDERQLQPMILKNVADIAGVDISTVSRITCNKYADTPFGMILLKDLFTEGLTNERGETTSNKVIQHSLRDLIENEDKAHPLTDKELVVLLKEKGFKIARRTVAKYREVLNIPVSHMRRSWVTSN